MDPPSQMSADVHVSPTQALVHHPLDHPLSQCPMFLNNQPGVYNGRPGDPTTGFGTTLDTRQHVCEQHRHQIRILWDNAMTDTKVEWDLCGGKVHHGALQFMTQSLVTLVLVLFCIYQLVTQSDCNSQQLYAGIITFVVGIYIPHPVLHSPT